MAADHSRIYMPAGIHRTGERPFGARNAARLQNGPSSTRDVKMFKYELAYVLAVPVISAGIIAAILMVAAS
jgi:hypothetical protein